MPICTKTNLHINNMILEVTRRCNAKCRHCLRGDAQKVDISNRIIDAALKDVSSIDSITFTGGEPSLAVPRIRYFLQALKARKICLGSFYVVTNGKAASLSLVHALLDLFAYCGMDNEMSGLVISGDQFHREQIKSTKKAGSLYAGLSFFHPKERAQNLVEGAIIHEGRAVDEGLGCRDVRADRCRIESQNSETLYIEGDLYINALGDVIPGCDFSYESQEELKMGNVLKQSLYQIFKPFDINPKDLIETLSKKVA